MNGNTMKSKLIFKLPEDLQEYEQCCKASNMASILFEMTSNVKRSLIKHQDVSEEYSNGVEAVYEKLYELMDEHGINIDRL